MFYFLLSEAVFSASPALISRDITDHQSVTGGPLVLATCGQGAQARPEGDLPGVPQGRPKRTF